MKLHNNIIFLLPFIALLTSCTPKQPDLLTPTKREPISIPTNTATPSPPPTMTPTPEGGGSGQILFVSESGNDYTFYFIDANGQNRHELISLPLPEEYEIFSDFSPSLDRIVFEESLPGADFSNLHLYHLENDTLSQIAGKLQWVHGGNWSPDGNLFGITPYKNSYDVNYIDLNTGDLHEVFSPMSSDSFSDWSPDGTRILIGSTYFGRDSDLAISNLDGTDITWLNLNGGSESWSPSGTKIAFRVYPRLDSTLDANSEAIRLYDLGNDTTIELVQLSSPDSLWFKALTWSQDEQSLAFVANFYEYSNSQVVHSTCVLHIIDIETKELFELTSFEESGKQNIKHISWSPDGKNLVFTHWDEEDSSELFVIRADGMGLTQLTDNEANEYFPRWIP